MTRKNFCTICFEKWEFIYLLFTLLKSALQKIVPTNDEEMMQNKCTRPLTIWWARFLTSSLTFKKVISFNSSLTIKSEFILPHPLINTHFSDVIGPFFEKTNNLSSLLACRKVSDLRFYLKVESKVSRLPQSMVWNALLPIKCQFVSNCHVRSKT